MSDLVEHAHCPHCGSQILRDFDKDNRLFGNMVKCESYLCGKEFIVSCSQIYEKGADLGGSASVMEIIRVKDRVEVEEGQTLLSEFV